MSVHLIAMIYIPFVWKVRAERYAPPIVDYALAVGLYTRNLALTEDVVKQS
jgi:hypothetical protein